MLRSAALGACASVCLLMLLSGCQRRVEPELEPGMTRVQNFVAQPPGQAGAPPQDVVQRNAPRAAVSDPKVQQYQDYAMQQAQEAMRRRTGR